MDLLNPYTTDLSKLEERSKRPLQEFFNAQGTNTGSSVVRV